MCDHPGLLPIVTFASHILFPPCLPWAFQLLMVLAGNGLHQSARSDPHDSNSIRAIYVRLHLASAPVVIFSLSNPPPLWVRGNLDDVGCSLMGRVSSSHRPSTLVLIKSHCCMCAASHQEVHTGGSNVLAFSDENGSGLFAHDGERCSRCSLMARWSTGYLNSRKRTLDAEFFVNFVDIRDTPSKRNRKFHQRARSSG